MRQVIVRSLASIAGVALLTFVAHRLIPVNSTTVGFAYLLTVLVIASTWGFVEALLASIAATLAFNFSFLPPIGTLTIADPQNWVALFSFLATALIASRLSAKAERRARDAIERQQDIERLYTFSRSILLIDNTEPFAKQLTRKLAQVFELSAVLLYERESAQTYCAGPADFEGLEDQLRDAALHGGSYSDAERNRVIVAVRLGSEPIAGIALQGAPMPDSVLQGIANLVAIGLERARAQDMADQIEVARQSEQLRTTLIDAMAHEFKTPLTSIKAATTALLSGSDQAPESRNELLTIADEEADHLRELIDDSIDMARLGTPQIAVHLEPSHIEQVVQEVVASLKAEVEDRLEITCGAHLPAIALDRRLLKLAIKQLVDNALKYSFPGTPVLIRVHGENGTVAVEITDYGEGIPVHEQRRIFERFYRSPSVRHKMPGSGLGLSIAASIAQAHKGDVAVTSHPGKTTFRITLRSDYKGEGNERGSNSHS